MIISCLAISGFFSRLVSLVTSPERTEPLSTAFPKVFCKFSVSATKILKLGQSKRICGLTYLPASFPAYCFLLLFLNASVDTKHKYTHEILQMSDASEIIS